MCKTASKNKSKHTGSVIYALSIFICYPNYMHRIPNESPELIFGGYIWKDFGLDYRELIFRELILRVLWYNEVVLGLDKDV